MKVAKVCPRETVRDLPGNKCEGKLLAGELRWRAFKTKASLFTPAQGFVENIFCQEMI